MYIHIHLMIYVFQPRILSGACTSKQLDPVRLLASKQLFGDVVKWQGYFSQASSGLLETQHEMVVKWWSNGG